MNQRKHSPSLPSGTWLVVFCLGASLYPSLLSADDALQDVMCNIVVATMGTTGKAICTVNVIAMGIGALFGKISWSKAMVLVAAIGMVFGAVSLVDTLGYGTTGMQSSPQAETQTSKTKFSPLPSPITENSGCTQSSIVYN